MHRTIDLLKIVYVSGYLTATGKTEKPLNLGITAKSGDGKSYLLKKFAEANEGIYLLSQVDITANQFRESVGDFKSSYMIIYDDIRFRDDRTKNTILSQITSITDMEFNFVQEAGDTTESIKGANVISFNKDQMKSMQKVITTIGLKSRLFRHKWSLPRELYREIKRLNVPKYEDLYVDLSKIEYCHYPLDNTLFDRFLTDFRTNDHIEIIYDIGKNLGFSDEYILALLARDITWNLSFWKEKKEEKKKNDEKK